MKGLMLTYRPFQRQPEVVQLTREPPLGDIKARLNDGWLEAVPGFTSIEAVAGKPPQACVAYCDEEGKLKGLEHNSMATVLWDRALRANGHPGLIDTRGRVVDHLVGPVVVLTGDDEFMRSMQEPEP